jgi:hypothetical protein
MNDYNLSPLFLSFYYYSTTNRISDALDRIREQIGAIEASNESGAEITTKVLNLSYEIRQAHSLLTKVIKSQGKDIQSIKGKLISASIFSTPTLLILGGIAVYAASRNWRKGIFHIPSLKQAILYQLFIIRPISHIVEACVNTLQSTYTDYNNSSSALAKSVEQWDQLNALIARANPLIDSAQAESFNFGISRQLFDLDSPSSSSENNEPSSYNDDELPQQTTQSLANA